MGQAVKAVEGAANEGLANEGTVHCVDGGVGWQGEEYRVAGVAFQNLAGAENIG